MHTGPPKLPPFYYFREDGGEDGRGGAAGGGGGAGESACTRVRMWMPADVRTIRPGTESMCPVRLPLPALLCLRHVHAHHQCSWGCVGSLLHTHPHTHTHTRTHAHTHQVHTYIYADDVPWPVAAGGTGAPRRDQSAERATPFTLPKQLAVPWHYLCTTLGES